jgi:hypothetical protein
MENPMAAYLDVSPMTAALRTTPDEFEMDHGWLHHIPSRHRLSFGPKGEVLLRAACDCTLLAVKPEQEGVLATAFEEWRLNYWRTVEINREFSAHFRHPSAFRRMLIKLAAGTHRWLMRGGTGHAHRQLLSDGATVS